MIQTNMKYIIILFISFFYLLTSCSDEELQEVSKVKTIPIIVTLPGTDIVTKAGSIEGPPSVPGDACEADHVQILVYRNKQKRGSSGYNAINADQYQYDATNNTKQPVACTASGNNKIARDVFNVDPEYDYWVFAYAYKETDKASFSFTTGTESLLTDKVAINPTVADKEYHAPEFYYGFLHTADDADDRIIEGNKVTETTADISLTGTIYRSVGRITLTLTDIPADVSQLNLIVEKYPKSCPLYAQVNGYLPYHPIGYPLADDITEGIVINSMNKDDITSSTAVFTSNTLRVEDSFLYVEVIKEGQATGLKYLVKCPDYTIYSINTAIIEYVVDSDKFTIPINFHVKIKGSYNNLTKGNLSIDGGVMDEFFGGFLE